MIRNLYVFAFALFTIFSYSQNYNFQPNVSHAGKHLIQKLNKGQDSLLLESKKTIRQVDILNDTFLKSIDFNSNLAKIDLKTLPIGNYVILARLGRKRIVMYLEKTEDINVIVAETKNDINDKVDAIAVTGKKKKRNQSDLSLEQKLNKISKDENPLFWVVYEVNSGFGSNKTMSLEYKSDIPKLVNNIELELQTEYGKNNKLLVFEIYNRSKFMTRQLRNKKFYKSKKSKIFNVVPIYSSVDTQNIDSKS